MIPLNFASLNNVDADENPVLKACRNSSTTILDEVILDYNNLGNEAIKLKTPEEVYYDLWYEARSRAKLAREEAIKAYLEAKNIKRTPNTISIHRKKDSNTLYTVNALNAVIKNLNNGVLDKSFMVDWSRYENTLLLTNGDDLRRINLVLMKRIDL